MNKSSSLIRITFLPYGMSDASTTVNMIMLGTVVSAMRFMVLIRKEQFIALQGSLSLILSSVRSIIDQARYILAQKMRKHFSFLLNISISIMKIILQILQNAFNMIKKIQVLCMAQLKSIRVKGISRIRFNVLKDAQRYMIKTLLHMLKLDRFTTKWGTLKKR